MKDTIRFSEIFETLVGILATALIVVGVMLYAGNETDRIVMARLMRVEIVMMVKMFKVVLLEKAEIFI